MFGTMPPGASQVCLEAAYGTGSDGGRRTAPGNALRGAQMTKDTPRGILCRMPRTRSPILAAALAALLVTGLAACSSEQAPAAGTPTAAAAATPAPGEVSLVDAEVFASTIASESVTILDVRTPAEFAAGHIDGAVNIDIEDPNGFTAAIAALDGDTTYAVYCRSGNRSASATAYMLTQGFDSVLELDGGIISWDEAGLPIAG